MALMLLWEVDHQRAYPSGEGPSAALTGFTRRLQERVGRDPDLSQWLVCKEVNAPLSAGLAPSCHRRWAVKVVAPGPGEPQGWYEDFVARWKAYLEVLARPRGSRPLSMVSEEQAGRIRPEGLAAVGQAEDQAPSAGEAERRAGRPLERESPPRKRPRGPEAPAVRLKRGRAQEEDQGQAAAKKKKKTPAQALMTSWVYASQP